MLTVVIPAYNVEDYVGKCVASVLEQADRNSGLCIRIVIDGATDATPENVRRAASQRPDLDIEIINQTNQGLSAARNTGLAATHSEYVTFLDGDDFWLPGYLDRVLKELGRYAPDILEYDALMVNERGASLYPLRCASGNSGKVEQVVIADFLTKFRCFAWARVYRTSLFATRPFPVDRRFEDTLTIPWIYRSARRIVSIGLPLIAYRQRQGSILSSPTLSDIRDLTICTAEAIEMYKQSDDLYWSNVALRALQQSCSRIERLPFSHWTEAVSMAKNVPLSALPLPGSLNRKLLVRYTLLYIALLFLKRRTIDPAVAAKRRFSALAKQILRA